MSAALAPLLTSVLGSVASGFIGQAFAPDPPNLPAPAAPPPAPEVVPTPVAPEVVKEPTEVAKASEAAVIDTEAARVRATKRRRASQETQLLRLNTEEDDAVILTKSLLGED